MTLFEHIDEYLALRKKAVIVTVIGSAGSTPRDVGARMLVCEDGKLFGTIGGGSLEHEAYQNALSFMGTNSATVRHVGMQSAEIASSGMICGGDVDLLFEPVQEQYTALYRRIHSIQQEEKHGIVVTVFKDKFSKTLVEDDMTILGDRLPDKVIAGLQEYFREKRPLVTDGIVIEPLQVSSRLYIFGAGHVSQYISRIAKLVDFSVTIVDDRQEFANPQRFPEADNIIVQDFRKAIDELAFTGREYAAIVTRGHQHDAAVLQEVLKKRTKYIGMIGSRRKVRMIMDHMKQLGFDEKAIDAVHAPIGLPISAETPQEIGVSIVAELIKTRGEE
ncbi:MAG TPA: XdhC family protein [Syntrophorhabdaceae bacterium]|nr:XdhC family protein [Syntrophorhabdaceae bacterium]